MALRPTPVLVNPLRLANVIFEDPLAPFVKTKEVGLALMLNVGAAPTVTVMPAVRDREPLVPITVTE